MDPNAAPTVRIKFPANLRVGYCQIPAAEFDPAIHELWVSPHDHDKDGTRSGPASPEPTGDLASLRAEYQDLVGKRPFPGWDAAELQRRIDEKLAE